MLDVAPDQTSCMPVAFGNENSQLWHSLCIRAIAPPGGGFSFGKPTQGIVHSTFGPAAAAAGCKGKAGIDPH